MCGVRLVDRVPTDILCNRLGVVAKIEDIIQNHLWWYGHVMHGDINSQIYWRWNHWEEEEGSTKEIVGKVCKEGFGTIWLEKRECRTLFVVVVRSLQKGKKVTATVHPFFIADKICNS